MPEGDDKDLITFDASENGYSDLEQPEPLMILYSLRNMRLSYWQGGLSDQPYVLVKELNAAATGESNYQAWLDNRTSQLLRGISGAE